MNARNLTATGRTAASPAVVPRCAGEDRRAGPPLNQVALSVVDLALTERWFREGLGFRPAGGSRIMMRGPLASAVQGLARAASTCWWLVDRNEWFSSSCSSSSDRSHG